MPCYDAQGNLLYYTDAQHSYGECAMPTAPPPAGNRSSASVAPGPVQGTLPVRELPNVLTQPPPAKVTFPIANLSFPAGMEEPPIKPFIQLPPGTPSPLQWAPRATTVYPPQPAPIQNLPQPPGTVVRLQDYFRPVA